MGLDYNSSFFNFKTGYNSVSEKQIGSKNINMEDSSRNIEKSWLKDISFHLQFRTIDY